MITHVLTHTSGALHLLSYAQDTHVSVASQSASEIVEMGFSYPPAESSLSFFSGVSPSAAEAFFLSKDASSVSAASAGGFPSRTILIADISKSLDTTPLSYDSKKIDLEGSGGPLEECA